MRRLSLLLLLPGLLASSALAQSSGPVDTSASEMRPWIERYAADRAGMGRRWRVPMSDVRRGRMADFHREWSRAVEALPFEEMSREGKVDWILLRHSIADHRRRLETERARDAAVEPLLPFFRTIVDLAESRRRLEPVSARPSAETMETLRQAVGGAKKRLEAGAFDATDRAVGNRAARRLDELRSTLGGWYRYHRGYDPLFTWWVTKPYEAAESVLEGYAAAIRRRLVKGGPNSLRGDPIGRKALLGELAHELIPYSPEELVEIAKRELAWCEAEMAKAARRLGFEDWRKAQEHVKGLHVDPGKQSGLIRDLALEAVDFLEEHDLVTVPALAKEIWRMEMMSPRRQRMSPYFLGGETVQVAFPTDAMSHADKLMSLRGNNRHFSRAVVHHELIPGHHLQGFMASRHRAYRREFSTAFLVEGWALYWEMLLWDLNFPRSPEDRIGMLFWRKHRCARIIFSLSFHLGTMTAEEAVEFLIDRVGHERNNATAEVRRSVSGGYGPLYQAAYMLGGLQLRSLHEEVVASGKMTNREFHDAVLRENSIPIELIRASLTGPEPTREFHASWRFYELGEPGGGK